MRIELTDEAVEAAFNGHGNTTIAPGETSGQGMMRAMRNGLTAALPHLRVVQDAAPATLEDLMPPGFVQVVASPDVPNYAELADAEMLNALGADAMKWAEAFLQIVARKSITLDAGYMVGWFAAAICRAQDEMRWKQEKEAASPLADPRVRALVEAGREARKWLGRPSRSEWVNEQSFNLAMRVDKAFRDALAAFDNPDAGGAVAPDTAPSPAGVPASGPGTSQPALDLAKLAEDAARQAEHWRPTIAEYFRAAAERHRQDDERLAEIEAQQIADGQNLVLLRDRMEALEAWRERVREVAKNYATLFPPSQWRDVAAALAGDAT